MERVKVNHIAKKIVICTEKNICNSGSRKTIKCRANDVESVFLEETEDDNSLNVYLNLAAPPELQSNICNTNGRSKGKMVNAEKDEKETFMREIGLDKTGLNQLIKEGYELLNLDTFFTSGPEESRAWTIKKNTIAPKAASVIHTDFEKNFIRAETVTCEDFIKFGSVEKCKENGKLRIEGKDYIVKDGDVLYFRVNP